MTITFDYDKKQVLQALRYHFISRPEIRILIILINVFAITSAGFFYYKKIQPIAFLTFSLLWFLIMVAIWLILPSSIYRRNQTFKDHFKLSFLEDNLVLETSRGKKDWHWESISYYVESPNFFYLYFDPRSFFLVPKDAMEGEVSTIDVRNIMNRKLKRK